MLPAIVSAEKHYELLPVTHTFAESFPPAHRLPAMNLDSDYEEEDYKDFHKEEELDQATKIR